MSFQIWMVPTRLAQIWGKWSGGPGSSRGVNQSKALPRWLCTYCLVNRNLACGRPSKSTTWHFNQLLRCADRQNWPLRGDIIPGMWQECSQQPINKREENSTNARRCLSPFVSPFKRIVLMIHWNFKHEFRGWFLAAFFSSGNSHKVDVTLALRISTWFLPKTAVSVGSCLYTVRKQQGNVDRGEHRVGSVDWQKDST